MPFVLLSMHTCVHTFGLAPSLRRAEMEVKYSIRQANVNAVCPQYSLLPGRVTDQRLKCANISYVAHLLDH